MDSDKEASTGLRKAELKFPGRVADHPACRWDRMVDKGASAK